MLNLLDFIQENGSANGDGEIEKLAEAKAEQEYQLKKFAEDADAQGRFIGLGFSEGLIKRALAEASGAETSGVNNENPPTAAQTPSKGGIEVPSNAPGPNESLKTVGPDGGDQYNNELFQKKLEERRRQAGLANIQNEGVSTLSGAQHGTSAMYSLDHEG